MNIIKDESKSLKLSPLNIYLLARENEFPKVLSLAEEFNSSPALNRGMFKIFPLEADKEESRSFQNLPGENNIVVRLIENLGEDPRYLASKIDFSLWHEEIVKDLKEFLIFAARQDIANIYKRINSYTSINSETDERRKLLTKFSDLLQSAIEIYEGKDDGELRLQESSDSNALYHSIPGLVDKWVEHHKDQIQSIKSKYSKGKLQQEDISELIGLLDDLTSISEEVEFNPDIQVEVVFEKRKKKADGKGYTKAKRVFKIYDKGKEIAAIDFNSKDPTLLYVLMLIKQKEGDFLRREDILRNNAKAPSMKWISRAFHYLYPEEIFESWVAQMTSASQYIGHRLSDAKGKVNRSILNSSVKSPKIIRYLNLFSEDEEDDLYYKTNLRPQNIILPKGLYEEDLIE